MTSVSLKYINTLPDFIARKCKIKFKAAKSIKTMQTNSIIELLKWPILSLCVENPPIAIVEKLCAMESKILIPAKKYDKAHINVRPI